MGMRIKKSLEGGLVFCSIPYQAQTCGSELIIVAQVHRWGAPLHSCTVDLNYKRSSAMKLAHVTLVLYSGVKNNLRKRSSTSQQSWGT